jgi:RimJ/RimL family protein N-acetyltransferase
LITLRRTAPEDAEALLACYSDEKAVPLFNSDNCNGDDFYYTTLEQLRRTMDLWEYSYQTRSFVRWTIVANNSGDGIGTIEMFGRNGRHGVLRIDLRSDYETQPVIADILAVAAEYFYDAFGISAILTKAVPAAAVRIETLRNAGYSPYEGDLVKHGDYFIRTKQ